MSLKVNLMNMKIKSRVGFLAVSLLVLKVIMPELGESYRLFLPFLFSSFVLEVYIK